MGLHGNEKVDNAANFLVECLAYSLPCNFSPPSNIIDPLGAFVFFPESPIFSCSMLSAFLHASGLLFDVCVIEPGVLSVVIYIYIIIIKGRTQRYYIAGGSGEEER